MKREPVVSTIAKQGVLAAAQSAADWLLSQQQAEGDFPWTAGDAATFRNTQGATALGLLRAYSRTTDPMHLAGAIANGDCLLAGNACIADLQFANNNLHRFSTHDPYFLQELSATTGDPAYAQLVATDYWAQFAAGTYGGTFYPLPDGNGVTAAEFADVVVQARASIPEYVAWDLSKTAVAAHQAGETTARDAFLQRIRDSINAAAGRSAGPPYNYDVIGLAGGLWAAAMSGQQIDPTAGLWASAGNNAALAALLVSHQLPGGGFAADSNAVLDSEADVQTTGWAVQALHAVDPVTYKPQILAAIAFMESLQQPGGQFLSSPGAAANSAGGVENHAEGLEGYVVAWLPEDRYIATLGSDAGGNDCSHAHLPCLSLQHAVDQSDAGNTIHVAAGNYVGGATLPASKSGLRIVGEGATASVFSRGAVPANNTLLHVDGATGVTIENLHFSVDRTFVYEGILCNNGCTGLTVLRSSFRQTRSAGAPAGTYGRTNAISAIGSLVTPAQVAVRGTVIGVDPASPNPTAFRAGVAVDYGHGAVGGAMQGDGNDILSINHDVIAREVTGGDLRIQGNTLRGFGVQITTPQPAAGAIQILDNLFQPAVLPPSPATAADQTALRLMHNATGKTALVQGNTFDGHERALSIQNFPGVTLDANDFTPRAGSSGFTHVTLSNKVLFSGTPLAPVSGSLAVSATRNQFRAGSIGGTGVAIQFLNDNAQLPSSPDHYGAISIGGAGSENEFADGLRYYYRLDDHACASSSVACEPLTTFYASTNAGIQGTPVVPFAADFSGTGNRYDGVLPAAMSAAQKNALLARTFDDRVNGALGLVDYGFLATQTAVYVDDTFAGSAYGQALTFVHGDPVANGRAVHFGIDAFATIPAALPYVLDGGKVYIAKGNYVQAVNLNKHADLIGDGNSTTDTVLGAQLVIAAGGVDAIDRLEIRSLRVQGVAATPAVSVPGSSSHLRLSGVVLANNAGYGLNLGNGAAVVAQDDIRIEDSSIQDNVGFGMNVGRDANVSDVVIERTTFSGNDAGLTLFDTNASGTGQITGWVLRDTVFRSNAPNDVSAAGGGLWLKTGGSNSRIENFLVEDSLFEDNGSGGLYPGTDESGGPVAPVDRRPLNRAGILVRARPGTFLKGVRLCGNTFRETATPGTQDYGIQVYDHVRGTAPGEYAPVEVCGSTVFDGLDEGISGYEQAIRSGGIEPRVDLTGTVSVVNAGIGWDYIDLGRKAVVYVDDSYAGTGNGAAVVFTHPALAAPANAVFGADAFATIAEGLAASASGGTVYVAAGAYLEGNPAAGTNLAIDRPVSLIGAQAGADARNRSDAGASVVRPAFANAALSYSGAAAVAILDIASDDVRVDGFVFDGDNPARTSGVAMGAADPDVDSGIFAFGSRIALVNNVVRNLVYAGINGYNFDIHLHPAREGNLIQRNWIRNIDAPSNWGLGVLVQWNYYASISDNLFSEVRVGIQSNYFTRPVADPATHAVVRGNVIHASRLGIYHNYHDADSGLGDPSTFAIDANRIFATANPAASGVWSGIVVQALYDGTAAFTGNDIDGSLTSAGRLRTGYLASQLVSSTATPVSIDGGNISGVDYGVLATDGAFFSGAVNDLVLADVAFSNIAVAAIHAEDTAPAGAETVDNVARVTVAPGNTFAANVLHHGALSGPLARIDFAPGTPLLQKTLVRAAGNGHRGALPDSSGNVRVIEPGVVNDAIADTAAGGAVTLATGSFAQNVVVDKGLTLRGPQAGVAGDGVAGVGENGSRDGSSEAVLSAVAGNTLRINADDVVVDGITFTDLGGANASVALGSGGNFGGNGSNVAIRNNRFVDLHGTALYTNGPPATPVSGWTIEDNLFDGISGGDFSAINLWKASNSQLRFNTLRNVAFGGIQLNSNTGVGVFDNRIENTGNNGINIGPDVDGASVLRNVVLNANSDGSDADEGALTFYWGSSNVTVSCNVFDTGATGVNAVSTKIGGALALGTNLRVFHNTIVGNSAAVSHNNANSDLVIGSNWYGGAATPAAAGTNAVGASLATELPATPIAQAACGDNLARSLVMSGGSPQATPLNQAFALPLRARVIDVLGGAVDGATVAFAAPLTGASATLAASAITDFDGIAQVTASANSLAGSYNVVASTAGVALGTQFALTNGATVASLSFAQVGSSDTDTTVGTAFQGQFCATVLDAGGNPMGGVSVGFFAPTTGASAAFSPTTGGTDALGVACSTAIANGLVGSYVVQAQIAGVAGSNTIGLTNLAGDPTQLLRVSGNGQTATFNSAFGQPLRVRATDAFGNPVAGQGVTFSVTPVGGALATFAAAAATNAAGETEVAATANAVAGSYTVSATASFGAVDFGLTNIASAIFVTDGALSFNGTAGAPLSAPLPTVRVLDNNGNPVVGANIAFALTSGGGAATGLAAVTGSDGRATVGSWTLGADAGSNTMTAQVTGLPGLPTHTFTATGVESAGIAIDKSSTTTVAEPGDAITYSIVASHVAGPSNAASVDVLDVLPAALDTTTATWICIGSAGASCGVAGGNGDVDVTAAIPVGGSITVTLTATVKLDVLSGTLVNTAIADLTSSVDPTPANNVDDHIVTIAGGAPDDGPCSVFCDGFEADMVVTVARADLKSLGRDGIALAPDADALGLRPTLLFDVLDRAGQVLARVDGMRDGGRLLFRARHRDAAGVERFTPWQAATTRRLDFGWGRTAEGAMARVGVPGKGAEARFLVGAGASLPHWVRTAAASIH